MIQIIDGLVCKSCMPVELLSQAETVKKYRIIIYYRTHSNWASCESTEYKPVNIGSSEDRSMAITMGSSVILADELNEQIRTSDSIDLVVSFIMLSGLNLLIDRLAEFTRKGKLRVITTSYMGGTEYIALKELFNLQNAEVRVELDPQFSRLHAKSFIFLRKSGESTAYVGSANISKSALTSGEEWVVKLREQDVPLVIEDLKKGFDALWNSGRFKPVTEKDRAVIEAALEHSEM